MGCGSLIACEVGGLLDRWEFFIHGSACSQSSLAEKEAGVGELVISKELFRQLEKAQTQRNGSLKLDYKHIEESDYVLLEDIHAHPPSPSSQQSSPRSNRSTSHALWRSPTVKADSQALGKVPLPNQVLQAAKGYIPRPVIEMITSKSMQSVNELRKVSVVFINLLSHSADSTLEPEEEPQAARPSSLSTSPEGEGGKTQSMLNLLSKRRSSNPINPEKTKRAAVKANGARDRQSREEKFLLDAQNKVLEVQAAAYTYYGTLRQVIVDDKGFVAIVVFGLPPLFHEDNAARAIKVATKLFKSKDVDGTAGICTGTVFCGAIGSSSRAEYCVTGDCINLAARLMCKAKTNRVLCDTNSKLEAEATSNEISFTKLDKIMVKGKDEPIDVFEPKRVTLFDRWAGNSVSSDSSSNNNDASFLNKHGPGAGTPGDPFRVVGNAEQKQALSRVLFTSKSPAKAVLIEGIRGQGKTCMADWAAQVSDADYVFTSRAESSENQTPFFVWRPILLNILMIDSKDNTIHPFDEPLDLENDDPPSLLKRAYSEESTASFPEFYGHAHSHVERAASLSIQGFKGSVGDPDLLGHSPKRSQIFRVQSFPDLPEQKLELELDREGLSKKVMSRTARTGTISTHIRDRLDVKKKQKQLHKKGLNAGERFFQLSSDTGVVQLAKKSPILQTLRMKGRVSRKSLQCLNEIIPVLSFGDDQDDVDNASRYSSDAATNSSIGEGEIDLSGAEPQPRRRRLSVITSRLFNPNLNPASSVGSRQRRAASTGSNTSDTTNQSVSSGLRRERKVHRPLLRNPLSGLPRTLSTYKPREEGAMDIMLALLGEAGSLGNTLVIIDDAHNMDHQSKELLRRAIQADFFHKEEASRDEDKQTVILSSGLRVRFVLTFLPTLLTKDDPLKLILNLCHEEEDSACVHTVLQPFTPRESALFLSSELEVSVGEDLLSFLHVRAKGNPHSLFELFETLENQSLISVNPDTGVVTVLTALSELVSDTLLALPAHRIAEVYSRFDMLGHHLQLLLKLASVIGKVVPVLLLRWLFKNQRWHYLKHKDGASSLYTETTEETFKVERAEEEFASAIAALKTRGFLSHKKSGKVFHSTDLDLLVFNRDDERIVIYSMMLRQDRRAIHKDILLWFEEINVNQSPFYQETGLLGYHALISEQYVKSFAYFEKSIEEAIRGGDVETAISFVQQSNEILELADGERQIQSEGGTKSLLMKKTKLYFMWGQCYAMQREWVEALKVLEVAIDLAQVEEAPKSFSSKICSAPRRWYNELVQSKSESKQKVDVYSEQLQRYGEFARLLHGRIQKLQKTVEYQLEKVDQLNTALSKKSANKQRRLRR